MLSQLCLTGMKFAKSPSIQMLSYSDALQMTHCRWALNHGRQKILYESNITAN